MSNEIKVLGDDQDSDYGDEKSLVQFESSRVAQEIQASIITAKKFPRDLFKAHKNIMESCKRKFLAEQAMYAYNRGGALVTGPSIRLAEVLAQNWGNLACGITELEQTSQVSTMLAFCVDLETNYRKTITFNVKNERHTKTGIKRLTDPRDIYENNFNLGARRLRACILAVIPGDIIEEAVDVCEKTMQGDKSEPLIDKLKRMAIAFESIGVSQEMIEKKLNHKLEATLQTEAVTMSKIYKSIVDGMSKKEDWFGAAQDNSIKASELTDKFKTKKDSGGKENEAQTVPKGS